MFNGCCPVVNVPFNEDYSIDFESLAKEIDFIYDRGCKSICLFAFNSEPYKLSFDEKIERYELDPDHVGNIDVSISEYDYSPSEEDLSNIKRFMEDNGEYSDDYSLVGPVPQYQYGFTSLDQIDVRDLDRENGCLCFKLVKGNEVTGYVHYDPYDDGSESQIDSEINEADKTEKDINKYYAHLSPIGYIFADKIVEENEDDPDHSPLNRMVAEKIRMKIKEEERKFGVYQF